MKDNDKSVRGPCVLWKESELKICDGNLEFIMRSHGEAIAGSIPMRLAIKNTLWFLERLPEVNLDGAHKALATLEIAIRSASNVVEMRQRH